MVECSKSVEEAEKFQKWADNFLNFEKTPQKNIFWLDTMREICRLTGNPQDACNSFHIAGSKGKGSVSKMIASILHEAGFLTGIYSSPHILDFVERMSEAEGPFRAQVYKTAADSIIRTIESISPENLPGGRAITWFELATLYGMQCFKEAGCSWAVYEVGLGGRLDATNVITPKCCCINRIEKEHTEYLGDTLELIAGEKGGIIKNGIPVVIGKQSSKSVENVFKKIAEEKNSEIIFADKVSKTTGVVYKIRHVPYGVQINTHNNVQMLMNFTLSSNLFSRDLNVSLKMPGEFQADNAAVASIAIKKVFPNIDEKTIENGLSKAVLPGRFEIVDEIKNFGGIPFMVLDGAHTAASVQSTVDTFMKLYGKTDASLIFGCASDKDVEDISKIFIEKFSSVMLTKPGNTKASDLPRCEKAFEKSCIKFSSISDYEKAILTALRKADGERRPVLVTGSFYLVSEVKKILRFPE